jgi:HEAT repeat protein
MKKLLLLGGLVAAGALGLQDVSQGHGGTYRGPGDTVPPGGGGGGGGGGPSSPGPSGPSAPGPAGPSTPGASTPGAPAGQPGGAGGGPTTPGGGDAGPDLTVWDFWWGFNKEPYLDLKARIHESGVLTGSDDFFLGRGEKTQSKDSLRPSEEQIRGTVVPALKRALAEEKNNDILTGSMIALAKIGDVVDSSGKSEFAEIIMEFLPDGTQEIAETAAVALGVLGDARSEPILTQLLLDKEAARRLLGKAEVPYRTRAFAAYGLGLVAHRSSDNELRQKIAETLIDVLNSPKFAARDIKVASMTALGLCPIDSNPEATLEEGEDEGNRKHVISRKAQLAFLVDYFDPAKERANKTTRHWFVRAHAPTAMARLMDKSVSPEVRAHVVDMLLDTISRHAKARREVQWSASLALGSIGTSEKSKDGKSIDNRIRQGLIDFIKNGDPQSRRFAMISLAQSGGTPGEGEFATAGENDVAKELQKQLARGKFQLRSWAGLSIGVFNRRLNDNDRPMDAAGLQALTDQAAKCDRPQDIGAYLIGLGICKWTDAKDVALDRMDHFTGDDDARGYCAVALGLMGERDVIEPIQELIKTSKYRPALLKQAAIALGLLGDKELVDELTKMLGEAKGLATQAAISTALGAIGDSRSIDPLVEMLGNDQLTETARGFSAVALGIVCDKEPLPWNTKISVNINYRANTVTLTGDGGTGILDIL